MNLQCSDWFTTPPNVPGDKWLVARSYDTIGTDSETGELLYGAGFDVHSSHDTKEDADIVCSAIKGTLLKEGFELIN